MKKDIIFDMETSDPDDAITLCWLAANPNVNLRAVTIAPGSKDQIGIVRHILKLFDLNIPVGAERPNHEKSCVSAFHYSWLGNVGKAEADALGGDIIGDTLIKYPDSIILTGGPLGNIKRAIEKHNVQASIIVMQGGFAGDNVVPAEHRLPKFAGKITCPTFNFNGNVEAAKLALSHPGFRFKYLISKNVCHGVTYDAKLHERFHGSIHIKQLMDTYLKRHPSGKLLHDPLAACCAVNLNLCRYEEVKVYREKGEWGCDKAYDTDTFISIAVDKDSFYDLFCAENK